jgi:hypothetical protein
MVGAREEKAKQDTHEERHMVEVVVLSSGPEGNEVTSTPREV